MANYDVSIKLAIAGAKELDRVNKQTEKLRSSINAVNKTAEFSGKKPVRNFNNLSKSVREANEALNEAATGTKEFNHAVKNLVQVEAKFDRQMKQRERRLKIQRLAQKEGISFSKAKILLAKQEAEAEAKLAAAKNKTANAEKRKKIGSTISSAAIGGAFPLLFGQTGAAAIGGGLGGLAGGAIGGQFGFALSIVGTALGSAIDKNQKFNESLATLNTQFITTSGNTQILAADVDRLAKRLQITKEEAIAALSAFKEFGSGAVAQSLTRIFGTDSAAFDTLAATNRQAELAKQIFAARKEIGNETAKQLLQQNLINDGSTIELALAIAKRNQAEKEAVARAKVVTLLDKIGSGIGAGMGGGFTSASEIAAERAQKLQAKFDKSRVQDIENLKQSLKEVRELLNLVNEANGQFGQSGVLAFSAINDKVKDLQDEMKALQDPIRMAITLSDTIATSFEDSFKGIIKGTMTVADAFRNMLNKIADHFLDTAARMLANQFQQGLLGLFGNLFTGGFAAPAAFKPAPGTFGTNIPSGVQAPGMFNITPKATGGPVKGGSSYLVGERGPEMFSPGVSGMITPNHALGGGTSVVVNVDATGSSVEGDEDRGRELGRLISVAVQSELVQQKRPGGLLA